MNFFQRIFDFFKEFWDSFKPLTKDVPIDHLESEPSSQKSGDNSQTGTTTESNSTSENTDLDNLIRPRSNSYSQISAQGITSTQLSNSPSFSSVSESEWDETENLEELENPDVDLSTFSSSSKNPPIWHNSESVANNLEEADEDQDDELLEDVQLDEVSLKESPRP